MEISESVIRLGLRGDWVFGSVFCNFHGFFGGFVIYISPVTMGLMAFNRYMRICKSEQQSRENLFTVEVSRLACLCVGFCRLLYCCTEVSWSSGFCLRPGICPLRSSPPKRNWKDVSLCLCSHMFPLNPVTNSNI